MNEFWKNIVRYPRFFISSVIGLLLVILTPLKTLFKINKFRGGLIFGIFFFSLLLGSVIEKMLGL